VLMFFKLVRNNLFYGELKKKEKETDYFECLFACGFFDGDFYVFGFYGFSACVHCKI
jgi:hypothetical protein